MPTIHALRPGNATARALNARSHYSYRPPLQAMPLTSQSRNNQSRDNRILPLHWPDGAVRPLNLHQATELPIASGKAFRLLLARRAPRTIISRMDNLPEQLKPGTKVKVIQQIPARDRTWSSEVVGTIIAVGSSKTGSWYAHARNSRLWLDRMTIRKDNGEISNLNLDRYSRIEVV